MIVCDVETTGLDSRKNSIVSLGAVDFEHPQNTFYGECRVFNGAKIDRAALKINGFDAKRIKCRDKKPLRMLMKEFTGWAYKIKDITIAGENPRFDLNFIAASLERYKLENKFGYRTYDLHSVCYNYHVMHKISIPLKDNYSGITLDYTLRFVGLPEEPKPHNGLRGAKLEAEAFSRMFYGKSLFKEYGIYPVPKRFKS